MKTFLLVIFLYCGLRACAQSETHHFITYDTTINLGYGPGGGFVWLARISRPARMFVKNDPDAALRPAIIHMGGQGESGTNVANLRLFGPHYWLEHGWDGGVVLGNGTHYPIIITLQPTYLYPQTLEVVNVLKKLLKVYHIKRNAVHLSGLSQGAFAWTSMICHQSSPGDETGMKLATSIVALQGQANGVSAAVAKYAMPGWTSFGHWAKKYGGRFFGLEGTGDGRDVWKVQQPMNDSVPGSAYYAFENYGNGAHCCWNQMFDPSVTDWQCVPPITNPDIRSNTYYPNSMGTYRKGTNVFQWMLQQGDTSMVGGAAATRGGAGGAQAASRVKMTGLMGAGMLSGPVEAGMAGPGPVIVKVAVTEYRTGYLYSDGNYYSFYHGGLVKFDFGGRRILDVATGFNLLLAMDDEGYVWTSRIGDAVMTRYDTDSSGAPFNRNTAINGYANTYTSIRSDGSLWYWGDDTFHLYHSTGRLQMRPVRLSPAGMKVKKVVMGCYRIHVLTTNGQVWEWMKGKSLTPVKKALPRPAVDIFGSHWDYAGCIIPDGGSAQTMGYPYVWGGAFGFWGGNAPYTEPTSVKELWGVREPIVEIAANYNTTHYITRSGRLYGIGDNVMGEIGNGVELVNQHHYKAPYSWTFNVNESLTGAPAIEIGKGIKWKKLFAGNFLSFYKYATDEHDSLYSWGRNKALVLGNGFLNMQEAKYPNAMDVLAPTMVHPLSTAFQTYNFIPPTIDAGQDQVIRGTVVTLNGSATPPMLVKTTMAAANGIDTINYPIVSYKWTKVSGPGGRLVITTPNAASTTVTGLAPGTYVFNLLAKDSNTGTHSANVRITVKQ